MKNNYLKIKTGWLLAALLICSLTAKAQDPSFTQAFFNPIYINPAFVGANDGMRISLAYRNQWNYVPGTYSTATFSIDTYEPKMNSGIGFRASHDQQGEGFLTTNTAGFTYQYGFRLRGDKYIGLGVGGNAGTKFIDWTKLEFSDQYDALKGKIYNTGAPIPTVLSRSYGDAEAGILFKSRWYGKRSRRDNMFSAGFAVHHMLQPNESLLGMEGRTPVRYTLHASLTMPLKNTAIIREGYLFPHIVFRKQADFYETLIGVIGLREPLLFGLSYHNGINGQLFRNTNALAATVGWQQPFNGTDRSIQISYSYDLNLSGMSISTFGTHEITALIFFDGHSILGSHNNNIKESPCLKVRKKGYLPPL